MAIDLRVLLLFVSLVANLIDIFVCGIVRECGKNCNLYSQSTLKCTDVPECIPDGITDVEVYNATHNPVIITTSNFTGENWNKVLKLRISDSALTDSRTWIICNASFTALGSVTELYINIKYMKIFPDSLVGLSTVKVLDVSGCYTLDINELISVLNGTDKLAGLNRFVLTNWNKWDIPYDFDNDLIDAMLPRNITDIDVSNSHITFINLTSIMRRFNHLRSFNLSLTTTSCIYFYDLRLDDVKDIEVWDVSRFGLPNEVEIVQTRNVINGVTFYYDAFLDGYEPLLSFPSINATGIIKNPTSFWINNSTWVPSSIFHFPIKSLELKDNHLNRFDINIIGDNITFSLEYLGLSNNNMEFLHRSILSTMPNLTRLDLSRNQLYKMNKEDSKHFGQLLVDVPALTHINLSNNSLTYIPVGFFNTCHMLTDIDLSFNKLNQFTFTVRGLDNLRNVDLRNNNIQILDASSLSHLKYFTSHMIGDVGTAVVMLSSNPISCSRCETKQFLKWLITTELVDIKSQELKCIDENGNRVTVTEQTLAEVQYICIRITIIISACVSSMIVFSVAIAMFVWLHKRRKWLNTVAHRQSVVNKIREGNDQYEYVVFFSYCSKDDVFAKEHILSDLRDNLRTLAGIDINRNLVSTGDATLRPGFYVHDEIDLCLDRSSAVVILVTENYCTSEYCGSEIEKAFMKKKPVILMFKEHVREDLMSRTMKDIYRRNVRILWEQEDGKYVLQTTWENICTSIIDLIE